MENNYKELLKEIEGKDLDEVRKIVNSKVKIVAKDSYIQQFLNIQDIIDRIDIFDDYDDIVSYLLFKEELIFNSILNNFTDLEVLPEDAGVNMHNINLEIILKENEIIKDFCKKVEDALNRRDMLVIQELNQSFSKLPNIDEIERLKNELSHVFDDTEENKLQQINKILEFNDPTMKMIKDTISTTALNEIGVEKNGNGNRSK